LVQVVEECTTGVHNQYYAATVVTFEQFLFAAKSTLGAALGQTTYAKHS
jgi:hypothetical protein